MLHRWIHECLNAAYATLLVATWLPPIDAAGNCSNDDP
jgi:hypothetical protein